MEGNCERPTAASLNQRQTASEVHMQMVVGLSMRDRIQKIATLLLITKDWFYWERVKFGLKPTLRVLHVVTMATDGPNGRGYVIAEKQLYASHYFHAAPDLTFCIPAPQSMTKGFYLIKVMGSQQAGLTGMKGSMVRKVALGRSAAVLQKSPEVTKRSLEQ